MNVQVDVLCVLTPCSDVVGHQCFRWPYYLHLQGEVPYNRSSVTFTSLYDGTTQKPMTCMFTLFSILCYEFHLYNFCIIKFNRLEAFYEYVIKRVTNKTLRLKMA